MKVTGWNIAHEGDAIILNPKTACTSDRKKNVKFKIYRTTLYLAEFYYLEYDAIHSGRSETTCRRDILLPYSESKRKPDKRPTWSKHQADLCLVLSSSAYFSALKMRSIYSSETSADFSQTTWRTLQSERYY